MCGIFGLINYNQYNIKKQYNSFLKGKPRGPEFSILKKYNNVAIGFHRLAINGLNNESNQPFEINNVVLVCNGEIYNYKELAKDNNIELQTDSDCEIILHLYLLYGVEYTLNLLDGVFSFSIYDKNTEQVILARDPYGVRPLYFYFEYNVLGFASELKSLYNLCVYKNNIYNFLPGNYMIINNTKFINYACFKYCYFPFKSDEFKIITNELTNITYPMDLSAYSKIYDHICSAVKKRVIGTTDRPIACLLSGGLDSSLICALVNKYNKILNPESQLKTFCIGLEGSEDLKYAKIVADHINSDHHEIVVSEDDFFNVIPEVIKTIESYDTTTVRASVGNYLVSKYIKEHTNCKVIFNGDGADELMGGYLYMKKAPNAHEFDRETKRLLQDIYMYDVLRSDKSISSNGLEPRTPFLDRSWVEYFLTIDKNVRYNTTKNNCEKFLIRKAVDLMEPQLVPKNILWRTKEAFSDGVSSLNKSWFEIIQEKIDELCVNDKKLDNDLKVLTKTYNNFPLSNNTIKTKEQAYYRYYYNKYYENTDHLIPYYWMPKYIEADDASARTLNVYNENNSNM